MPRLVDWTSSKIELSLKQCRLLEENKRNLSSHNKRPDIHINTNRYQPLLRSYERHLLEIMNQQMSWKMVQWCEPPSFLVRSSVRTRGWTAFGHRNRGATAILPQFKDGWTVWTNREFYMEIDGNGQDWKTITFSAEWYPPNSRGL